MTIAAKLSVGGASCDGEHGSFDSDRPSHRQYHSEEEKYNRVVSGSPCQEDMVQEQHPKRFQRRQRRDRGCCLSSSSEDYFYDD